MTADLKKLESLLQAIEPDLLSKACPMPKDNHVSMGLECIDTILALSQDPRVKRKIRHFVHQSLIERLNHACSVYLSQKDCLARGEDDHLLRDCLYKREYTGIDSFRIALKDVAQLRIMCDFLGYSPQKLKDLVHEHFTTRRVRELLAIAAEDTGPSNSFEQISGTVGYLDLPDYAPDWYFGQVIKNRKNRDRLMEVLSEFGISSEKVMLQLNAINQSGLVAIDLGALVSYYSSFEGIQKYGAHAWIIGSEGRRSIRGLNQYLSKCGLVLLYAEMESLLKRVSDLPEITFPTGYDDRGRFIGETDTTPYCARAKELSPEADAVLSSLKQEYAKAKDQWGLGVKQFKQYLKTLDVPNRVNDEIIDGVEND
jgi:hypothetical protein